MMVHNMMLARAMPEFELTLPEAEAMATAILNYTRHLESNVDPKGRDFLAMLFCLGTVEGFRVVRVVTRRKGEKSQARAAAEHAANSPGGTVINMESLRPQ